MRVDMGAANRHASLCLIKLRFLSPDMKRLMRKEGIWEDLIQELYITAWTAYIGNMSDEETNRYAQRHIYAFLKAYGFRMYGSRWHRMEIPLSAVFLDIGNRGVTPRDWPPSIYREKDDDHLDEKMLDFLKKHPEGLPRRIFCTRFGITVQQIERHLAPFISKRVIIKIERENALGRPLSPLLVVPTPDKPLPQPEMPARERDERIRNAYFVEGKSIKRITREFRHSKETIRRALWGHRKGSECEHSAKAEVLVLTPS